MKTKKFERPIEVAEPRHLIVKRPFRWDTRVLQRGERFSLEKLNDKERRRVFGMYEAGFFARE